MPEDDMVHFVIESVEGLKLWQFKVNERGTGSGQSELFFDEYTYYSSISEVDKVDDYCLKQTKRA